MRTLRTASSLTSRNISAAPPARTLMPFHYLGSLGVSQESGAASFGSISSLLTMSPSTSGGYHRLFEVGRHHPDVIGKRHFRFQQVGVPDLFPFETVKALIANLTQGLHLALHRDVALSREDVLPFLPCWNRVFEVCVPDPPSQ